MRGAPQGAPHGDPDLPPAPRAPRGAALTHGRVSPGSHRGVGAAGGTAAHRGRHGGRGLCGSAGGGGQRVGEGGGHDSTSAPFLRAEHPRERLRRWRNASSSLPARRAVGCREGPAAPPSITRVPTPHPTSIGTPEGPRAHGTPRRIPTSSSSRPHRPLRPHCWMTAAVGGGGGSAAPSHTAPSPPHVAPPHGDPRRPPSPRPQRCPTDAHGCHAARCLFPSPHG